MWNLEGAGQFGWSVDGPDRLFCVQTPNAVILLHCLPQGSYRIIVPARPESQGSSSVQNMPLRYSLARYLPNAAVLAVPILHQAAG